jgi:hypothetical protein
MTSTTNNTTFLFHDEYRQVLQAAGNYLRQDISEYLVLHHNVTSTQMMIFFYIVIRSLLEEKKLKKLQSSKNVVILCPASIEKNVISDMINKESVESRSVMKNLLLLNPNWLRDVLNEALAVYKENPDVNIFLVYPIEEQSKFCDSVNICHINTNSSWYIQADDSSIHQKNIASYFMREFESMATVYNRNVLLAYSLSNTIIESIEMFKDCYRTGKYHTCRVYDGDSVKIKSHLSRDKLSLRYFIVPYILNLFLLNISDDGDQIMKNLFSGLKKNSNNRSKLKLFKKKLVKIYKSSYQLQTKKHFEISDIRFFGSNTKITKDSVSEGVPMSVSLCLYQDIFASIKKKEDKKRSNDIGTPNLAICAELAPHLSNHIGEAFNENQNQNESDDEPDIGVGLDELDKLLDKYFVSIKHKLNTIEKLSTTEIEVLGLIHLFEKTKLFSLLVDKKPIDPYIFSFEVELLRENGELLKESKKFNKFYQDFLKETFKISDLCARQFFAKRFKYLKGDYGKFTVKQHPEKSLLDLVYVNEVTRRGISQNRRVLYLKRQLEICSSVISEGETESYGKEISQLKSNENVLLGNFTLPLLDFLLKKTLNNLIENSDENPCETRREMAKTNVLKLTAVQRSRSEVNNNIEDDDTMSEHHIDSETASDSDEAFLRMINQTLDKNGKTSTAEHVTANDLSDGNEDDLINDLADTSPQKRQKLADD